MNNSTNKTAARHQFDRLMSALLSGNMSPREHEQLESLLRTHPGLMDCYVETTGLHLDLKRLASHPENSVIDPGRRSMATRRPRRSNRYRAIASTLALAIFVACTGWIWSTFQPPRQRNLAFNDKRPASEANADARQSLPIIAESASARIYGRGFAPRPGDAVVMRDEQILTRGSLVLAFPSGAEAILIAPCVFMAMDAETLLLRSGQISVHAPPGAEGFRILTPSAKIVDFGTRFVVGVGITGETALRVVDGAASLSSNKPASAEPVLLREGESAFVDVESPPMLKIPNEHQIQYVEELPDRVVGYEATSDEDGLAEKLLTLTVQRGGNVVTYDRKELVPARLIKFASHADTAIFCTRRGDSLPDGQDRLGLLTDWSLVTGIINPAPSFDRASPEAPVGMEFEFNPPVVNGPGPEIVLFDLQVLVHTESGDNVRISTPESRQQSQTIEITQFDLDLGSRDALDVSFFQVHFGELAMASVSDLIACRTKTRKQAFVRAKALATGVDLSDLGYQPGEIASRLTLEDDTDNHRGIDPVLIVALPAIEH